MSEPDTPPAKDQATQANESGSSLTTWIVVAIATISLIVFMNRERPDEPPAQNAAPDAGLVLENTPRPADAPPFFIAVRTPTNKWDPDNLVVHWWERVADGIKAAAVDTGELSNIIRKDYVGSESCQECHPDNHADWSNHPHRWMNALAQGEAIRGDFESGQTIQYKGGEGRFMVEGGTPKMIVERGDSYIKYGITRTIGSRFFQYYIGKVEEIRNAGIDDEQARRDAEAVLPFGYWMANQEWVPVVHVLRSENRDDNEIDPFHKWPLIDYDSSCSDCHTTWPLSDWMLKSTGGTRLSEYTPRRLDFHLGALLQEAHPKRVPADPELVSYSSAEVVAAVREEQGKFRVDERVSLGVTCESCHLGAADHVRNSTKDSSSVLPSFSPVSPHLYSGTTNLTELTGRARENLNFVCARCHSGTRPNYANGTHTWNSTEFADAARGFCYNPSKAHARGMNVLTCVDCHDPHVPTGKKWSKTPEQDDASCLECHQQFQEPKTLAEHTHHQSGSTGSRCMNCHMPRINEGLERMVRTHRIQSPVPTEMVEANQPNACNLCHLEESVDWTVGHVRDWYGKEFDDQKIAANYPDRSGSAAKGWLKSEHAGTRLTAAEALAVNMPDKYLNDLLEVLVGDPHLINRQFVQQRLLESTGASLKSQGYQFYMSRDERQAVIAKLKPKLVEQIAKRD